MPNDDRHDDFVETPRRAELVPDEQEKRYGEADGDADRYDLISRTRAVHGLGKSTPRDGLRVLRDVVGERKVSPSGRIGGVRSSGRSVRSSCGSQTFEQPKSKANID